MIMPKNWKEFDTSLLFKYVLKIINQLPYNTIANRFISFGKEPHTIRFYVFQDKNFITVTVHDYDYKKKFRIDINDALKILEEYKDRSHSCYILYKFIRGKKEAGLL